MMYTEKKTNMNLLEKNLSALDNRYPELSKKIRDTYDQVPENMTMVRANSSFTNLLIHHQDKDLFYYDSEDPLGYSYRYIKSLNLKYSPFLVFLGFGLGYQVISALNDFSEKYQIRHIFIIEKDIQLFKAALELHDFSQVIMHPDITLFVGYESPDFFMAFRHHFANNPEVLEYSRDLKFVILPAMHLSENEYYGDAYQAVKNALIHIFEHIGNDPYDSLIGLSQTLSNIVPVIQDPGIIAFKDTFRGKPGIVIGAGPSLNKNIKLLREAQHKAVLIAVDAALKPLLEAGITPHIVTNIERTKGQDVFFSNMGKLDDTFFVFSPVVPPETYSAFKGPKIIAHRYEEFMNWLGIPKGALSGGPLVGNFAFDIAQYMGCDPVILVGQDLSFKPTGTTHVDGMVCGNTDHNYKKETTVEVEGNYSETLLATRSYDEGRKSIEIQIKNLNGLCINATEGGAKINGALFLDLRNTIDNYCKTVFDPVIKLKTIWSAEKARQTDMESEQKRIGSILDESLSELDSAINDCRKSIRLIDVVTDQNDLLIDNKPNPNVLQIINALNRELNDTRERIVSSPSFVTFEMVIQSYHLDLEMRRNFTYEQYYHSDMARLKSFLLMREWFATVGQLILSTHHAIKNGQNQLLSAA